MAIFNACVFSKLLFSTETVSYSSFGAAVSLLPHNLDDRIFFLNDLADSAIEYLISFDIRCQLTHAHCSSNDQDSNAYACNDVSQHVDKRTICAEIIVQEAHIGRRRAHVNASAGRTRFR